MNLYLSTMTSIVLDFLYSVDADIIFYVLTKDYLYVGGNRREEMSSLHRLPSTKPELLAFLSRALILSSQLKWNFFVPLWFFSTAFHSISLVCLWARGLFDSFAIVSMLTLGFLCLKLFMLLCLITARTWLGMRENNKALQKQREIVSPSLGLVMFLWL